MPAAEPDRFIPAWAGNTANPPLALALRSVHPRVGGEHDDALDGAAGSVGSSPRGRGTPACARFLSGRHRFIPAWAGNTAIAITSRTLQPVHPRVGGEHLICLSMVRSNRGSSPRGRGTQTGYPPVHALFERRFIPAWAGNTLRIQMSCTAGSSPRGRGTSVSPWRFNGSSPRGRGTLRVLMQTAPPVHRVGGDRLNSPIPHRTVHPRVGGEHILPR